MCVKWCRFIDGRVIPVVISSSLSRVSDGGVSDAVKSKKLSFLYTFDTVYLLSLPGQKRTASGKVVEDDFFLLGVLLWIGCREDESRGSVIARRRPTKGNHIFAKHWKEHLPSSGAHVDIMYA